MIEVREDPILLNEIPEESQIVMLQILNPYYTSPAVGKGFTFYRWNQQTGGWDYITYQITDKPILRASTREQFEIWKNWRIRAVACEAVYEELQKAA